VQGAAVADEAEKRSGKVDVSEEGGLALGGYDCMSYHVPGASSPVLGVPEHEVTTFNVLQGNVRYRFASRENAQAFQRSHLKEVAPRFGGFCALAVAKNALLHSNPEAWCLGADQALFLFCCDAAKQAWQRDAEKNRADAEDAWPALASFVSPPPTAQRACCASCSCCAKRADDAKTAAASGA
jgi:hypothetical protein